MLSRSFNAVCSFVTHATVYSYHAAQEAFYPEEQQPQRLDTLQVLLQLAIVAHKPRGTLLRIKDNQITLVEPDQLTWLESQKKHQGDHLCHLKDPLKRAQQEMNPHQDMRLKRIFEGAIEGLEQLKKTYCHLPIAKDAIDQYKTPIQEALAGIGCPENTSLNYPNGWTPRQVQILDLCLEELEDPNIDKSSAAAMARGIEYILMRKRNKEDFDESNVAAITGKPLRVDLVEGSFQNREVVAYQPPQQPLIPVIESAPYIPPPAPQGNWDSISLEEPPQEPASNTLDLYRMLAQKQSEGAFSTCINQDQSHYYNGDENYGQ